MANEVKKFLDQQGLQLVWSLINSKFIDNTEFATELAKYEKIEDLTRDYYNKTQITAIIDSLAEVYATKLELAAEKARAEAAEDTKVDKSISSTAGVARIFNEADGGGAKFEAADGTASFAGVNSDTNSGIGAQLYDINVAQNKGSKLDVTKNGIYYTTGDTSALSPAQRDVADNELVVKKDIKDLAGGMHFIGVGAWVEGSTIEQMIANVYSAQGKSYADRKAGDLVILKSDTNDREFVCDTNKNWVELGDQGLYATKAELASEATERSSADATLQTNINTEASTRATADTTLQTNIDAEATRAQAAEAALQSGKLDIMPGDEHSGGNAYNLPYYFSTTADANKVTVTANTVTLDGNKTYGTYSMDVTAATQSVAGLMSSADKEKLDGILTLTQQEIEDICK